MDINFLVGAVPAEAPEQVPLILNWIESKELILAGMVNAIVVTNPNGRIVTTSQEQGAGAHMIISIYASCSKEQFKEIFKTEYDERRSNEIPALINEIVAREAAETKNS